MLILKNNYWRLLLLGIILLTFFNHAIIYAAEELTLTPEKDLTYATVKTGKTLTADNFIPTIEENHHLSIKEIAFANNQRANTSRQGLLKTEVSFTTDKNETYTAKLPYLVEAEKPTIVLEDIHYDSQKNQVSFKTSDSNSTVYMIADKKMYACLPDTNGLFKGKYNPNEHPKTLRFVSFNNDGEYSAEHVLDLDNNKESQENSVDLLDASTRNEIKTQSSNIQAIGQNTSRNTIIILVIIGLVSITLFLTHYFLKHKRQN